MTARSPKRRENGTAAEIAEAVGVTPRTVRNYIAEPRLSYVERTYNWRQFMLTLKESGYTYRQIAEEMGITVRSVEGHLRRARKDRDDGFKPEPPRRQGDAYSETARIKRDAVLRLRDLGYTHSAIAEELCMTARAVEGVIARARADGEITGLPKRLSSPDVT